MTSESSPSASPWLTAWFKPRETITRVVSTDPRHQVWLLAALGLIFGGVLQLLQAGWGPILSDGRVIAGIAIGGTVFGIVGLYYSGFFFRWAGNLFGGHASADEVRAAMAWGQLPMVLGGVAGLVVGLLLSETGVSTLLLSVISAVAGLWTVVLTWIMFARVESFGFWRTIGSAGLGWVSAFFVLILLILPFRMLAYQPFNTPSGAMLPTLRIGDVFVASKWPYGFSRYTFFNLVPFSGRILAAEPKRGDVVVFKLPRDNSTDYVKRVIGLPGDEITVRGGVLFIDGKEVSRRRVSDFAMEEHDSTRPVPAYEETLPNGVTYTVLDLEPNGQLDNVGPFKVPEGKYFMMGDNRDNSVDSRSLKEVGYVPFENLVGRASLLFSRSSDRFGTSVR